MRATLNLPPSVRLIEAALEGLVQVNRVLIETGVIPPSPLDTDVRYKRERSGLEEWDNGLTCIRRKWGDCEDLNGWECAGINLDEDPEAVCTIIQTGPRLFHCVVRMSDGSIRDVCPALGMRVPGTSLEGIPWVETRAENIIGAGLYRPKASHNTDTRSARQRTIDRTRKLAKGYLDRPWGGKTLYTPKASTRTPGNPYQPKSSTTRPRTPETSTPEEQQTADDAAALTMPTSVTTPQAMTYEPMQDFAEQVYDEAEELEEEPSEDEDEETEETEE